MQQFGYQTIDIIGSGTFGTVYKCIDGNNNVRCIKQIKLVNASNATANTHLEMVQQEIYLLQHLIHPRIISLYEYFCSPDNKSIQIVMEYASHGSLSKLIASRSSTMDFFEEYKIKLYLIDMMLGIEYLHMKNVVHKDLKPCNILICDNERLKIADFGVSKITDMYMVKPTKAREVGGSPIYMAPETLIHNHFDFASDIWALGCILYELCMLQATFVSVESMDELIRCALTKDYVALESGMHKYSEQLILLCDHMLCVDIQTRATIKDIIRNPLITIDYYHAYFQFDA